jgi:hypothetical protein
LLRLYFFGHLLHAPQQIFVRPLLRLRQIPLNVLEQRPQIQRFMEIVRQQLDIQYLLFQVLCVRLSFFPFQKGGQNRLKHVLAQSRVGFFAPAHHVGVQSAVLVGLLPRTDSVTEDGTHDQRHQRHCHHLGYFHPADAARFLGAVFTAAIAGLQLIDVEVRIRHCLPPPQSCIAPRPARRRYLCEPGLGNCCS